MRMDWKKPNFGDYHPGTYLCEIKKAEEKLSQTSGLPYMNVELHEVGESFDGASRLIGWDILMMAGKGLGLAQAKLRSLGFDGTEEEIRSEDFVGRRAWVTWRWEDYNGDRRLKVASQFRPEFSCGYAHKDQVPKDASSSITSLDDDSSIPF